MTPLRSSANRFDAFLRFGRVLGTFTQRPVGGDNRCAATYPVGNQRSTGSTVNGTTPTNGSKVTWTWSGNRQITNVWNGVLISNGQPGVTITNAGYNGSVAPGGNTLFSFQAGYSGTDGSPTLTCTTS
jgi:hypothetical protein